MILSGRLQRSCFRDYCFPSLTNSSKQVHDLALVFNESHVIPAFPELLWLSYPVAVAPRNYVQHPRRPRRRPFLHDLQELLHLPWYRANVH